jgi:microcystin-dependent protein
MKRLLTTLLILLFFIPQNANAQSNPYIGQITLVGFNFCPRGYLNCDGQLLAINSNSALFSLLGTMYGGDGRTTFALPDLRGRVPMHTGTGPGLTNRRQGQRSGSETNTLTINQLPSHNHQLNVNKIKADNNNPSGVYLATTIGDTYAEDTDGSKAHANAITNTGGGQAVNNMQPYLVLRYCIATQGTYPSRN